MSENIIIQEGGVSKNLNAIKKIQTAEQGGGSVYWVPEDDIELGNKTIKKNGTYYAKTDDLTGYVKVFVNVPGGESRTDSNGNLTDDDGNPVDEDGNPSSSSGKPSVKPSASSDGGNGTGVTGTNGVSGINPNDGNEYHVTKNPNTGELVYTKIPSSIEVTKLPDKTTYDDGDTLNPSGIIVHKYFGDGTDAGTVLESELKYEPIIVTKGSEQDSYGEITDNGKYFDKTFHGQVAGLIVDGCTEDLIAVYYYYYLSRRNMYWPNVILVSSYEQTVTVRATGSIGIQTGSSYHLALDQESGLYWSFVDFDGYFNENVEGYPECSDMEDYRSIAIDAYGNPHGGGNKITVKWARPTDQKVLTDTFNVTVS